MNNFEESEMEPDNEEMANFRTWAVGTGKYSLTTSVRMTRTVRSLYRKLDLDKPSTEALWAYVERQLKKGRRDGTINNQMKDIAAWFRFKGIKLQVPSLRQRRNKEPWVPKDDEVFRLIRVCEEGKNRITALRNKTIIEIMAFCGLRLGEVVQLNISDVQNEYLHVRSEKLEAERKVGLPDFVRSDIMTYLKQRKSKDARALFTSSRNRLSYSSMRRMVKREGAKAGIRDMHPHALRHWCATRLVRSAVNLRAVQVHLGHASIATTQLYTHLSSEEAARDVRRAFETVYMNRSQ